jgi:hypothetical protein
MKRLVLAGCSLLWLMVVIARLPDNPRQTTDIGLDASWVLALPELLHQHSISGRDFHFTYGPLSQMLAYAGASLHAPWSGISSLPLVILAFSIASIVLMAFVLHLAKDFGWKECLFLYMASAGLNLFSEPTAFRPLALMLCAVIWYRTMENRAGSGQWIWAAATGAACFAAQLLTFELGLYSILMVGLAGLIWMMWDGRFHRRLLLERIVVVLVVYLAANLATDCCFALSSPAYNFFDYQRYGLETIRGFSFSQSSPWELNAGATAGLIIVALFAMGAAGFLIARVHTPVRIWILSLLVGALIELKSMMVRSDLGHITQSGSLLVFFLLSVGAVLIVRWRQSGVPLILWAAAFAMLWGCWPWAGLYAVKDLYRAFTGVSPIRKLTRLRSDVVHPERVLPEGLADQSHWTGGAFLAFPYEMYIPIALQRRFIAPVPMAYNASTEALQQFYIQRLEREQDLNVIYGLDGVVSTAVDGIPIVTRTPIIFDYLYTYFRLSRNEPFGKGFYLLQRDASPRLGLQRINVNAKVRQTGKSEWEIQLQEPIACSLVRLEIEIDYPLMQYLGHPAPLELLFQRSGTPVFKTGLCAIKSDAPFATLVSLMPEDHFHEIFGPGKAATNAWDRLRISPRVPDPLGVWPSKVDIRSVTCLLDYQSP